ncbi:MAG TPA: hypothetical protein VM935_19995 [Chitinophagaceae bacterium]|jgi:hypothetical protein|nr:hypothetical protein [Chitinophagaceae bacterium]
MKNFLATTLLLLVSSLILSAQVPSTTITTKAKYTNKQVTWYEYDYWLDGSLLSANKNADKFNDILFKKIGNKYYKAQIEGALNIEDWGVKRDYEKGNPAENFTRMQALFNYLPDGYTASVYVPTGKYYFSQHLTIDSKPVHLFGDNGTIFSPFASQLHFPKESMGLLIVRNNGSQESIIENLGLIGAGNTKQWMDGIVIRARVTLRGLYVKGFYNGIEGFANMDDKTDMSGSYIEKCYASENTNDGFFFGRVDGNAITVIGCDARDNGRYGFNDDSFLGNNFISCMAHYNKGGDFYVRDKANARSLFQACYSEGGNKTSQLGPLSTVIGGIWGTGYSKDGKKVLQ